MTQETNSYSKDQIDYAFVKDSELIGKIVSAVGTKEVRKEVEEIVRDYLKKNMDYMVGIGYCFFVVCFKSG